MPTPRKVLTESGLTKLTELIKEDTIHHVDGVSVDIDYSGGTITTNGLDEALTDGTYTINGYNYIFRVNQLTADGLFVQEIYMPLYPITQEYDSLKNVIGWYRAYKSGVWSNWVQIKFESEGLGTKEYTISQALNKNREDIDNNAIQLNNHDSRISALEEGSHSSSESYSIHLRKEDDNLMVVIDNGDGAKYHTLKKGYDEMTPEEKEQFAHGDKMDGYAYLISIYKRNVRRWVTPAFGKEWNKLFCKFDAYKNYTKFFVNKVCAYPYYEYKTLAEKSGDPVLQIVLNPNQTNSFGFPTLSKCTYWADLLHYAGHRHISGRKYNWELLRGERLEGSNTRTLKCRIALYKAGEDGRYTRVSNYANYQYRVRKMSECGEDINKRLHCVIY